MSHINPEKEKLPQRDTSLVDAFFLGLKPSAPTESQAAGDVAAMGQ